MSKFYNTEDYIRDTHWVLDRFVSAYLAVKERLSKTIRNFSKLDLEFLFFRILDNLPYGLFILFLGFFLTVTLFRLTENSNGIIISSIYTNSMDPAIRPGSLTIALKPDSIVVGDIITFKEVNDKTGDFTGRALTHRVVSELYQDNIKYITKGDNNENPDPFNTIPENILGEVVFVIPYVGYVDFLLKTIPGFIMFIVVPCFLLVREAITYSKEEN